MEMKESSMKESCCQKTKIFFCKIKTFFDKVFNSKLSTFFLLFTVLLAVCLGIVIASALYGGFYNFSTDDIIQYYPYVAGFFEKLKNGNVSLYDTTLFGGTSFFAGVYYIPFDIFTLFAFIFSFFMRAETAYSLFTILRPACGALLIYYVFVRRGMKTRSAFITGTIFFIGGITETYFVFPVYLGISFYAPLAMLIADLCVDKQGIYYLLLPLYSLAVILLDFYIAYMLIAFLIIYFLISMHICDVYSFFGKKSFIKNPQFYKRFAIFMFMVILGVFMACFILIPSVLYVLNESSRNAGNLDNSLWFYTNHIDGEYKFAFDHYFTLFCSFFIPNEPHRLLLNYGTDYIRNHASFYLTSGGFIYLIYFFCIFRKKENRLKFWVILFNILFMMPLFAYIFNFNTTPYSRWFFIPYMINFLAMAYAMDYNDFKIGDNKYLKIVPIIFLAVGLVALCYVMATSPDIYMHYTKTDDFFYPILIPSIIFILLYLAIIIISFVLQIFKKQFNLQHFIPVVIFLECIFAGVIMFTYIENTSDNYYRNKAKIVEMKEILVDYGYTDQSGYRINMDANPAKAITNANVLIGNVNFGKFFQSFYNTPLNNCLSDVFNETSSSWSRTFISGYNLLSANLFNNKYVVTWGSSGAAHMNENYCLIGNHNNYAYYELKDMPPFIVYDGVVNSLSGCSITEKEELLLQYAYIKKSEYESLEDIKEENFANKTAYETAIINFKLYQQCLESGIDLVNLSYAKSSLDGNHKKYSLGSSALEKEDNYYIYNLDSVDFNNGNNVFQVYVNDSSTRKLAYDSYVIIDTDGNEHAMHYSTCYYGGDWTPAKLKIKMANQNSGSNIIFMTYNDGAYTNFIETQSQYTEKYFSIDGDEITLKCQMPDEDKVRVIKTGYTYSSEWVVSDDRYETINVDGGFLGIIVPENIKDVDISLKYVPYGFNTSCKISMYSGIMYLLIATIVVFKTLRERRKEDEKNIYFSAML